jgi:hypothetical protein
MNWTGEYVIDSSGLCHWHDGLRIQNIELKAAYKSSLLLEFMIETFASMGVRTGMA